MTVSRTVALHANLHTPMFSTIIPCGTLMSSPRPKMQFASAIGHWCGAQRPFGGLSTANTLNRFRPQWQGLKPALKAYHWPQNPFRVTFNQADQRGGLLTKIQPSNKWPLSSTSRLFCSATVTVVGRHLHPKYIPQKKSQTTNPCFDSLESLFFVYLPCVKSWFWKYRSASGIFSSHAVCNLSPIQQTASIKLYYFFHFP